MGGVSVHIYRLHKALKNSKVVDPSQNKKSRIHRYIHIFNLVIRSNFDLIHIHYYNIILISILDILHLFKNFDIMATSHNPRLFETKSRVKKKIYKLFLKRINTLVVVGSHILEDYKNRKLQLPKEIIIETPFFSATCK